ncbi:MAG TPA: Ig-like domain-containing protein, partial [Dongiaceae bacterium]|nr:Ig-like domain-containing protein [Dongiaceae bacterium]
METFPPTMSQGVSPTAPVIFHFNTAMNLVLTAVTYTNNDVEPPQEVPVTSAWSPDHQWLTNTAGAGFPAGALIIWTAAGKDSVGNLLTGLTTGYFMTGNGGPHIAAMFPPNGTTNISATAPVIFNFSAPLDPDATTAQFLDQGHFPPQFLATTATWSADHLWLTNTPEPAFPGNTFIAWIVSGQDPEGLDLEGTLSGVLMTSAGGTGPAPTLVSVTPPDLASNVAPTAPVVFAFSEAMNTNSTAAQFKDSASPMVSLPVTISWSADRTRLTNTPVGPFPDGAMILWSLTGQNLAGTALAATTGMYWITNSGATLTNPPGVVLVACGESVTQTDTNLFEFAQPEFVALATANPGWGYLVTPPGASSTLTLGNAGTDGVLEFTDADPDAAAFATNYPAGNYGLELRNDTGTTLTSVGVAAGPLPAVLQITPWQVTSHVVLGQNWPVQWTYAVGGSPVNYLRVTVEQDGAIIFATPLPGESGALTGNSNAIVVPANVFTNTGHATVTLSAFTFTSLDTNSIPNVTLRGARQRTTTVELLIVDGTVPPPALMATQLGGVGVGEPFLNPLRVTNGVRPLRFSLKSGSLPPGLILEPEGNVSGLPTGTGTYDAQIQLTDLLGRSVTQALRVVTGPLPPEGGAPRLENFHRKTAQSVEFDLVPAASGDHIVEQSTNLSTWTPLFTTNSGGTRLTLTLPATTKSGFFRVRAPGPPAPNPLTVNPTLHSNVTATAALDEFGGTLRLTNAAGYVFALNVPPGALAWPETITMTDVAALGGLPFSGGLRAAVDLQPDGLMFETPARLDIIAPADVNPATVIGFGARPDGSQFALRPSFQTNRTTSLYLWHFSMAGTGSGSAGDAANQTQNAPDSQMESLTQQAAAAIQACRADPNCELNSQEKMSELITIYTQMADQVVLPKLKTAVADDAMLDDALYTWLQWLREMALLGIYDDDMLGNSDTSGLATRVRRAGSLAAQALRNGIKQNCDRCLQHDVWRIYRVLELARESALLGLDNDQAFWTCARKCLVFEMSVESEIMSSGDGVTYTTHTKGKARLRPKDLNGGADPTADELTRLMLIFEGSGSWDVTTLSQTEP